MKEHEWAMLRYLMDRHATRGSIASVCALRSEVDGIYVVRSRLRLSVKGFASTDSGMSESVVSFESITGSRKFS